MRVLIVPGGEAVGSTMVQLLRRRGFDASSTNRVDRADALRWAETVLVNLDSASDDGLAACRAIRAVSKVPLIVITEHRQSSERIEALNIGVDDYLIKPYDMNELIARIEATKRRRSGSPLQLALQYGDLRIDLIRQTVRIGDEQVELPRKDFQILALIAAANGSACHRERLLSEVWGRKWSGGYATLSVHINALRTRLGRPELIETVRGVGYRMASPQSFP